ncbi:unnamed protein product [Prorocentrum cordatum]|uniref:Uncharacterized protein n=1 Tax=Prorocentrum cordatum TaxID=2364126 RepID=A0ABN9V5C5_9DINO|nr:unnamed protein product [Polarella glacialis]
MMRFGGDGPAGSPRSCPPRCPPRTAPRGSRPARWKTPRPPPTRALCGGRPSSSWSRAGARSTRGPATRSRPCATRRRGPRSGAAGRWRPGGAECWIRMSRADGGAHPPEQLDAALVQLQGAGAVASRSLGLLERLTLEAEDLQVELRRLEDEHARSPGAARFASREASRQVAEELSRRFGQIRGCFMPAMVPGAMEGVGRFRDAIGNLNPFC